MFRNWNKYLAQMYRSSILLSTDNESFVILHYYWANFGWGKRHTDGMFVSHPHEVWLYTCNDYPDRVLCMQYHSTLQYPFFFWSRQVNG
jgi:hypothetical protein